MPGMVVIIAIAAKNNISYLLIRQTMRFTISSESMKGRVGKNPTEVK
jgi:hypothetical protein